MHRDIVSKGLKITILGNKIRFAGKLHHSAHATVPVYIGRYNTGSKRPVGLFSGNITAFLAENYKSFFRITPGLLKRFFTLHNGNAGGIAEGFYLLGCNHVKNLKCKTK